MVNSPALTALYRWQAQQYNFDKAMKAYMEGKISDKEISEERDLLTEAEDNFKNLVLSLEEENKKLKGM